MALPWLAVGLRSELMFKIKMALIVAVGLFIHTPRNWSQKHPSIPVQTRIERAIIVLTH
jgi:hypothetical protein